MSLKKKAINGARWAGLSSTVTGVIGLAEVIVFAILLGPAAMGLMAMAMIVVGFAKLFADLGLTEAVIYEKDPTRDELSSLFWLNVGLGTIVALVIAGGAHHIAALFSTPELVTIVAVVGLSVWINSLGAQFRALLRKDLRFGVLAIAEMVGSVAGFAVALVAVLVFEQGVWSLVWGVLATSTVQTAIYSYHGWAREGRPRLHFAVRDLKRYIGFGLYRSGASLLHYVNSRVDRALIGALMGPHALGLYSVAYKLSKQPTRRLGPIISQVGFPVLSKLQDDRQRLRSAYLRIVTGLMLLLAPVLIGLVVLAPIAVPEILGQDWIEAVEILQILAIVALVSALTGASSSLTNATGYVNWAFYWELALVVTVPPAIYFAAQTGSLVFVALALLALESFLFFFKYLLRLRWIIGSYLGELARLAGIPIAIATLMGLIVTLSIPFVESLPVVIKMVTLVAIGGVVYCGLSVLMQRDALADTVGMFANSKRFKRARSGEKGTAVPADMPAVVESGVTVGVDT